MNLDFMKDRPTLAEMNARPRAEQKSQLKTRLDEKTEKDTDDDKQLERWKKDVRERDKGRCRVCQVKTVKTLALDPKRGEAHHIARRSIKAVRHDRRNGLHTCLSCHSKLTRNKIFVLATAAQMFTASDGSSYINGDDMGLTFAKKEAA